MYISLKHILSVVLLCSSCVVLADGAADYIGVDYKYRWMQGHQSNNYSMREVLPSNYQGAQVYYAHRYQSDVGFDIGYEQSQIETQTYSFPAGQQFLGVNQAAGSSLTFTNRLRAVQFDLVGYMNFFKNLEAIGQLGFAIMQADMTGIGTLGGVTYNLAPNTTYNWIGRIGFALQYFLFDLGCNRFGVRASGAWEGTGNYRLDVTDEAGRRREIAPFNHGWSYALGLVAKF